MDGHEIFDQQRTIAPELAELIDAAIVRALIGRILGESRCISDDTASVARTSSGDAPLGLRRRTGTLIEVTVAGAAHWSERRRVGKSVSPLICPRC
jgi:hypothetical protein